jgi:hypothetical protein
MESHKEESHALPSWQAFLIILAILGGMIALVFVGRHFYVPSHPSQLVYNNYEFQKKDGMWHTTWQNNKQTYDIGMRFNPLEVENVSVSGTGLNKTFQQQPFYITFDPDDNGTNFKYLGVAVGELGLNLVRGLGAQIQSACTKNLSGACDGHPIVTCADDKAVIYLHTSNETKARLMGNCLTLQGQELDLIKAVDRVLYHFYRIMP